jgi:lipoprotein-anchoring transpeptidase ErfK/SrfK
MRAAGVATVLLLGLAGTPAIAQLFPLPPPQIVPPPFRPQPPVEVEDDDAPPSEPPPGYRRVPPPGPYGADPYGQQPGPQYGRAAPPQEVETYPLPPPGGYREQPVPGYEPLDPRNRVGRPNYGGQPPAYEPDPRRPNYGNQPPPAYEPDPRTQTGRPNLLPNPLDILRPPAAVGPAQEAVIAALPPEDRPESGPKKEIPPQFRRAMVDYRTREPAGTLIIDTPNTYLYLVLGNGKAMRYGIGVGREGFTWSGAERISRMAEWPDWHPPAEMIERQPYLPRFMAGGDGNPLGARALYLGKTLYRIHGTNQPSTIGSFVSSGCIRLTNEDIVDLYGRVNVGTRVVVLPGRPPASASAAPPGSQTDQTPPGPYNPLAPPRPR